MIVTGNMEKPYLGIDIGGSKIKGVLFDSRKNQWFPVFNVKTPKNKKGFLIVLDREINKIIQKKKIAGIGIGLPGIVNLKRGILIKAPNLPFLNNWQAGKFFSKFKVKTKFDNDSRCFIIGEFRLGAGRNYKNIVGIGVGTGIGGGIVINNKIYYGKNYNAGEFGHMIIDGKKNLEQMGAKKAFLKYGDRSEIIGIGVANIINILDPEVVILGGGGVAGDKVKIEIVRKTAQKYTMSPLAKKTPIIKGELGENSQAVGSAMLFSLH